MGDHHGHHHGNTSNIKVAFFLNLIFTFIEIGGGIFTNSMAILSDALHDFGDSLSLGLAWYFQKLSQKGSDGVYSYGYKRFSLTGAVINSFILLVGSVFVLSKSIPRILNPEPVHTQGMIILAILGVLVNGAAVLRLKKGNSINEKVVSLHLLEDVLGWVAVLIGAVIMYFFNWPIIDPILSVLIMLYILFNIYKNIREVVNIFMQGLPHGVDKKDIEDYLISIGGILKIHDLHIWSMDGEYNILTVHLVMLKSRPVDELLDLKTEIRKGLKNLGIAHATLEFEMQNDPCQFSDC